jgi:hypothetical protein
MLKREAQGGGGGVLSRNSPASGGGGLGESGWLKLGGLLKGAYTIVSMEALREIFVTTEMTGESW